MRIRRFFVPLAATLIASVQAASAGQERAGAASHTASHELSWKETPFGPLAAPVQGDFTQGRHVTFIRFGAGMKTPLHTHSQGYVGVVVKGVGKHWVQGQPETQKPLPAGSHWFMPGEVAHVSECLPGTECLFVIYQQDSFDFLPVETQ